MLSLFYDGLEEKDVTAKTINYFIEDLNNQKKEIRRGAATAVAAIAKIDIPIGEWANLIPTLHAASKHENINFKISSIITLGYICQEVSPDNFSLDDKEKIFQSIFLNFSIYIIFIIGK